MKDLLVEVGPSQIAHEPAVAADIDDTSAWFDLSKAKGVLIHVVHYRGGDLDFVLTVHEGTAASGTTAIAVVFPIWVATSAMTDPTLVRQTDAVGYTTDDSVYTGSMDIWFYIDGAHLTAGYRYVQLGTSGGHASSLAVAEYFPVGLRYQQDQAL